MTTTRLRCALGICISAALLVGSFGGAIALADPDSGDSIADQAVESSNQSVSSTTEPVGSVPDTGANDSTANSAQQEPTSSGGPMTMGCRDGHPGARADGHQRGCHGGRRPAEPGGPDPPRRLPPRSPPIRTSSYRIRRWSCLHRPPNRARVPLIGASTVRRAVAPVENAVATAAHNAAAIPGCGLVRFPVPGHRLGTSSPRFRTCSPRLSVLAPRSHKCRLILPLCSASPEWLPGRFPESEKASTVPACRRR